MVHKGPTHSLTGSSSSVSASFIGSRVPLAAVPGSSSSVSASFVGSRVSCCVRLLGCEACDPKMHACSFHGAHASTPGPPPMWRRTRAATLSMGKMPGLLAESDSACALSDASFCRRDALSPSSTPRNLASPRGVRVWLMVVGTPRRQHHPNTAPTTTLTPPPGRFTPGRSPHLNRVNQNGRKSPPNHPNHPRNEGVADV